MCDKMAISAYILKIVKKDPFLTLQMRTREMFKLYFVEICQVLEKLWLFNHKRADFWIPNFGLKDHFSASLIEREKIALLLLHATSKLFEFTVLNFSLAG